MGVEEGGRRRGRGERGGRGGNEEERKREREALLVSPADFFSPTRVEDISMVTTHDMKKWLWCL